MFLGFAIAMTATLYAGLTLLVLYVGGVREDRDDIVPEFITSVLFPVHVLGVSFLIILGMVFKIIKRFVDNVNNKI
jgi:hypothetical protein